MQRSKQSILTSLALVGLLAVAATGCAAEPGASDTPAPGNQATDTPTTSPSGSEETPADEASGGAAETPSGSGSRGEATLMMGDNTYTADLNFCSLSDTDALFHGPARDDSGDTVGYLDGDFTILDADAYGEARVDFGATGQFESSDTFVSLGDAMGAIVVTAFSAEGWMVIGTGWDQTGATTSSNRLRVICE